MSKDIKQASVDKAEIIGEVFNLYRVFYNQKSSNDLNNLSLFDKDDSKILSLESFKRMPIR